METLQSTIFIEFDVNSKKITFLRKDNIIDYDSNITSIYVRLKYKNLSGNTVYLTPSELEGYKFSLYTIKPVTNNINIITGKITDELKENISGGLIKFEIPRACTNRLGIVKCEIHIERENKRIGSSTFVLDVKQSLVTEFDDELLNDEDFPVLKQLILEIQKASNIDDNNVSEITTYSSDKIETIKEDLGLQIKERATKQELEVERKRIDTFTTLAEGSTTGDAELIDGRIGADNVTYTNLGSAIRTQFQNLNEKVDYNATGWNSDYNKTPIHFGFSKFVPMDLEVGGITASNGNNNNNTTAIRSDFITLTSNTVVLFHNTNRSMRFRIYRYNLDKTFSGIEFETSHSSTNETVTISDITNYCYRFLLFNNSDQTGSITLDEALFHYYVAYADDMIIYNTDKTLTKEKN